MGTGWAIVVSTLPGLLLVGFELRRIFRVTLVQYWNETLRIHLIPVVLVALICHPWNNAGPVPSLVASGIVATVFCLYIGMLIAGGYIPIRQLGREFFRHE